MNQQALIDSENEITRIQTGFINSKPMSSKKILGQFFTKPTISRYMASLISKPGNNVRLLDAGAGTGILTASTALHCLRLGSKVVHAVLYEIDSKACAELKRTLIVVQDIFNQQGAIFSYEIRCEDFVLSRPDKDKNTPPFDASVINPPYFKYNAKNSLYAKATADLYRGDPNIYASFMAIVLACMKTGGEMVSISPRSFTNGLYFKAFRAYLLRESALNFIHIFKRRDKIFNKDESSILQETIICHFTKGRDKDHSSVSVKTSDCDANIYRASEEIYPVDLIIDSTNEQNLIRIPESVYEARVLKQAETLETTFEKAGYFIATGRIVEHRTRHYITRDTISTNSIPLYRPHNVTPLTASWTGKNNKDVSFLLNDGYEKHTVKNGTYVLLKRVSSKDEKRRLISGVHLQNMCDYEFIGLDNKINYIGVSEGKLSLVEAYGLAAVFNSSFMDRYFRCISGNTQVNATEIRIMKFPSRKQVKEIGKNSKKLNLAETSAIDLIVNPILGVMDSI